MKIRILIILASLVLPVISRADVVTLLWEESNGGVTVTLSGSLDVTGWETFTNDYASTFASFRNDTSGGTYQSLSLFHRTSGGVTFADGQFLLRPWDTPTEVNLSGAFVSGGFAGGIDMYSGMAQPSVSAAVQTSSVSAGVYPVDGVYRFEGTTLAAMFGDRLSAWSAGAPVAMIGANQIVFTTQAGPGPAASDFRCTAISRTGANTFSVSWTSEAGASYRLQTSTDLIDWTDLAGDVTATQTTTTTEVPNSAGEGTRFWRVKRLP